MLKINDKGINIESIPDMCEQKIAKDREDTIDENKDLQMNKLCVQAEVFFFITS